MKICKVRDGEYPWDVRVEKICDSLVRAGHEVHLVCRNRRGDPIREIRDGISIHRLPAYRGPWGGPLSFPVFCNPVWLAAITRVVKEQRCDVVLVRDLPLALAGIVVGRLTGCPVVIDLAENYPAMLKDFWPINRRRPFNWIVRNPWMAAWVERATIRLADHVVVVVQEAADRLRGLGVENRRLSVVMNTPLARRVLADATAVNAEAANPCFDILYLGFLDHARGIEIAIRAMPAILARIANARLVIIGTGDAEGDLRRLAREMGVDDRVCFTGWVSYDLAHEWIAACSVGIVPHDVTESWMTTIPNKLFDYMASAKPVLVSEAQPVRRIVTSEACGLVFRNRDVGDFAVQVGRLADSNVRRLLGTRGRQAVLKQYNWGVDGQVLVQALEGLRLATSCREPRVEPRDA